MLPLAGRSRALEHLTAPFHCLERSAHRRPTRRPVSRSLTLWSKVDLTCVSSFALPIASELPVRANSARSFIERSIKIPTAAGDCQNYGSFGQDFSKLQLCLSATYQSRPSLS